MINLDTHILIFALTGELRREEHSILAENNWSISAIVLWELSKLAQLERVVIDLDDVEVTRTLTQLHIWPIDIEVAKASTRLDFDGDPADELIAATSVVHRLPLLTRDRLIRSSGLVPLALA